ncbi:UNVERIFIED_CONTAM: hypothetical protein PYX00_006639 [Menopon gallinae]|uniref:FAS1 domain-containing protein n=1 Tax=Menopon gallinae TaxID=328185 RepID=A0AAW2HX08_9NEOP
MSSVVWFLAVLVSTRALEMPDMSGISRDLTANLTTDQFFSLWIVFNDDEVQISDKPFTILAPKNQAAASPSLLLAYPDKVKQMLLDHMVLGQKLRLDDITDTFHFKTLGGKVVSVQEINGTLYANNAQVLEPRVDVPGGGVVVVLNDYLFPTDIAKDLPTSTLTPTNVNAVDNAADGTNSTFFQNLVDLLSFFKNGVRVFQHFLSRSNVSHLLKNDEEYTVLIPTDHAFQRWHPIDWGFYPFSVPDFTESVIINHFIPGNLRQESIKDGQKVKTLGGREIVFTRNLFFLSANGAPIVRGDTPIHHGNLMFISEVLFVSETEVQKLHQQNKDKETPPLLAFPWFGSQFLSHAFLALEKQRKFTHITRFLNLADLAPYVSGKDYSFFVPNDDAFENLGLGKVIRKGSLGSGTNLTTLGNKTIIISNISGDLYANDAKIIESDIFVYNLGTMFYIDKVLFVDKESLPTVKEDSACDSPSISTPSTIKPDVEKIPEELTEDVGTLPDVLLEEDGITKPLLETQSVISESKEELTTDLSFSLTTDEVITDESTENIK